MTHRPKRGAKESPRWRLASPLNFAKRLCSRSSVCLFAILSRTTFMGFASGVNGVQPPHRRPPPSPKESLACAGDPGHARSPVERASRSPRSKRQHSPSRRSMFGELKSASHWRCDTGRDRRAPRVFQRIFVLLSCAIGSASEIALGIANDLARFNIPNLGRELRRESRFWKCARCLIARAPARAISPDRAQCALRREQRALVAPLSQAHPSAALSGGPSRDTVHPVSRFRLTAVRPPAGAPRR